MVVGLLILMAVFAIVAKDCSGGPEAETATATLTEMPIAETLSKQLQEDNAKQQAEEQARQKKLQQEEQARQQAERQKKQQEEQRQQAERQKKQQQEREANFKSYKSRGDFYFNEYFDTGDSQAKQKAKQNYAKALQYKEDATVRKRYNSL